MPPTPGPARHEEQGHGEPSDGHPPKEVACSSSIDSGTVTRASSSAHCSRSFQDMSLLRLCLPSLIVPWTGPRCGRRTHGRLAPCSSRSASAPPDAREPADQSTKDSTAEADGGVSHVVADIVRVIRESGLPNETNAMFTNIEGEWDEVMAVVKQAVDVAAAHYPRVGLVLKADIRAGYDGQLTAKVERVEEHLRGR